MAPRRFYVADDTLKNLCRDLSCIELSPNNIDCILEESLASYVPITLVINGREIDLIDQVYEILLSSFPTDFPLVQLIVVSNMTTWKGHLFQKDVSSLEDQFLQRGCTQKSFELSHVENKLLVLQASKRVRAKIALLGAVFGEDGGDFSEIFQSLWDGELSTAETVREFCLPSIHISKARELLNLLFDATSPSLFEVLFEPSCTTLGVLEQDLRQRTQAWSIPGNRHSFELLSENFMNTKWLSMFMSFSLKHPLVVNFEECWSEYLDTQSLQPLHLMIIGPPKSGKSCCAKAIAQLWELSLVNVTDSVLFAFSFEGNRISVTDIHLPEDVRLILQTIKSTLQEKFVESLGTKKTKDKSAASDAKLEPELINDSFCSTLPYDLILQCISFRVAFDQQCVRKGYVLDLWATDLCCQPEFKSKIIDAQPVHVVVNIETNKEIILRRQIELMGAQHAKSKEGQIIIKGLESSLDSYFSEFIEFENTRLHNVLAAWLAQKNINVVEIDDVSNNDVVIAKLLPTLTLLGKFPSWISFERNSTIPETSQESNDFVEKIATPLDPNNASCEIMLQNEQCAEKYQSFLLSTVLPVLTTGLVNISRSKPSDPIKALAQFLHAVSEENQKDEIHRAHDKFSSLLVS